MNPQDSHTYRADVAQAICKLDIEKLRNKKILVTGASGLICSAIVDILLQCNIDKQANITIYALARNKDKILKRFPQARRQQFIPISYDATKEVLLNFNVDYIIHGASNASPEKYMSEPVDTLMANILGVGNLLRYATLTHVPKTIYISSSEVYGKLYKNTPLAEDVYGEVDVLAVRSAYSIGKRAAENLCVAYASQFGTDVSIVRPGHVYGPTAQDSDNRVSSAFARLAAKGENIIMKSSGTQIRSYCYCIDCATAVLTVLTRGRMGQAYNISNSRSVISIRQMAEIIAHCAGINVIIDTPSNTEKAAFNPMDNSSLDSKKLETLGWHGQFDACLGLEHTIYALREMIAKESARMHEQQL